MSSWVGMGIKVEKVVGSVLSTTFRAWNQVHGPGPVDHAAKKGTIYMCNNAKPKILGADPLGGFIHSAYKWQDAIGQTL